MRFWLLMALYLGGPVWAQSTVTVRFDVVVPGTLAPFDTVYLAGSFNGWNPGNGEGNPAEIQAPLPMQPDGPNRFTRTPTLPAPTASPR